MEGVKRLYSAEDEMVNLDQEFPIWQPFERAELNFGCGCSFKAFAKKKEVEIGGEQYFMFKGQLSVQGGRCGDYRHEKIFFLAPHTHEFATKTGLEFAIFGNVVEGKLTKDKQILREKIVDRRLDSYATAERIRREQLIAKVERKYSFTN